MFLALAEIGAFLRFLDRPKRLSAILAMADCLELATIGCNPKIATFKCNKTYLVGWISVVKE